ncbi:MAG: hypothetical protein KF886_13620 [Candidatus Hydrogenedentes bacterium]|nr:hypothetical protein [Candidatus Hydrogenedentota bacterium]
MPRPRRKPKEFTGRNQPRRELVAVSKWQNLVELTDFRGKSWRRFYKLETLASAIDKLVHEGDRFLQPAIEQLIGAPGRLSQIVFTLADEDALRFIFHVSAAYASRKRASFALIVAKNAEEATRRVALEYKHLKILAERIPDAMAVPIRSGAIFLPDRYRREAKNRDIGAYITTVHSGYEPLGIHRNGQYMTAGGVPHTFTKRETEHLRARMVTLIASAFHPIKRDGIDTHQIEPSTFQVHRGGKGMPGLKLVNCVHMQTRLSPAKVVGFLLTDTWKFRGVESPLAPEDPEAFVDAIAAATDRETAAQWIGTYLRLARSGKLKGADPDYMAALAEILENA